MKLKLKMKRIALDPGETTGVVVEDGDEINVWQIDSRHIDAIYQFLHDIDPDEIMYEQFHYRPNLMKAKLYSMQVIGVIRLYSERYFTPVVFTPKPDEAKAFWTDDKIKAVGLWIPGKPHAMDAMRVFLKHKMMKDVAWFQKVLPHLKDV